MAKRQNFVVGSINPNTETWTSSELNNGWDKYQVLYSGDLDGVFNAVSDYSNDSSQEIANAIQALTGAQPTGASQNELAGALQQMREEIETSSLTFKGYVATSAPSSSTYGLVEGNIWINASAMPTTFPVAASSIKLWNGTSWVNYGSTYTPSNFDFFRNINDNEGYYWFGGQWTVMSTDMSTTYFTLNQTSGKWEIKSSVNLPGAPTTTTPAAGNSSTRIATTAFVANNFAKLASPDFTGTPTAPTAATTDDSTKIATTAFVKNVLEGYIPTGGAANTSLSNLADAGKNISNWSSNVTNCITETSQDIKLELNNDTLTLKAGSKVYVPNGAGVFDAITTTSDLTISSVGSGSENILIFYTNGSLMARPISACFSGPTQPTVTTTFAEWYDTTNNVIKHTLNTGSTWIMLGISFPLCICSRSGGVIAEIKQVFNGFGYIGSTVFALPGVKGLIPNGRNADGTLKNDFYIIDSVITSTFSSSYTYSGVECGFNSTSANVNFYTYNEKENKNYIRNTQVKRGMNCVLNVVNGKITSFAPKQVFHAVDYNDFTDLSNEVVKTSGDQTIDGIKTFSSKITGSISGNCDGNAGTVTNGVYTTGNQTIGGTKTFSSSPVAPTPASSDNSQKVATTAWVRGHGVLVSSQNPTPENSYKWFRVYSDGWVEQGQCHLTVPARNVQTITLITPLRDTNYMITTSCAQINSDTLFSAASTISAQPKDASNFYLGQINSNGVTMDICWMAVGLIAL